MAIIDDLPMEVVQRLLKSICDKRTSPFDDVATTTLQKLRLTCRKFSVIVTPFLFENMTLDEKFQERHQLTRIIEFATQCPALAACVRRLQLKMAPVIRRPLKLEYPSKAESSVKWVCIQPRNTSRKKKKGEPPPNSSLLKQLKTWVVNPRARYEDWMEERPVDFMMHHFAFLETIKHLPNLRHIEFARSTHWAAYSFEISQLLEKQWGLHVSLPSFLDPGPEKTMAEVAAHCWEFVNPQITSLKLCEQTLKYYYVVFDEWTRNLGHLTELDLECTVSGKFHPWDSVKWPSWAALLSKNLGHLTQLRKLRLACSPRNEIKRLLNTDTMQWHSRVERVPCYFDDVLAGCNWPYLKTLSLVNWPMRQEQLVGFIARHSKYLKVLELDRISLSSDALIEHLEPPNDMVDTIWLRMAVQCARVCDSKYMGIRQPTVHYWYKMVDGEKRVFAERSALVLRSVCFQHISEEGMEAVHREVTQCSNTLVEFL